MKNKKSFICIILLLFIALTFAVSCNMSNSKIITHVINNKRYLKGNEITTLELPNGLEWKEGSNATAKWNEVENANYYLVNVTVFDHDRKNHRKCG